MYIFLIWTFKEMIIYSISYLLMIYLFGHVGILDKMNENETEQSKQQVPFNTILFSDERILTEHEKQTVLEYVSTQEYLFSKDYLY